MARGTAGGKQPRHWRLRRDSAAGGGAGTGRRVLRRGRRGLRAAAPYTLVAGVVVVASIAVWVLLGSTLLGVRTITLHGGRTVTTQQVAVAAAIPIGTPLARLDTAGAAARIARLPAVASVQVRRAWPNTVVVSITERTPVAASPRGTGYVLLDAGGVPFRPVATRPADLPVVRVPHPRPGDPATKAALTVASALTPVLRRQALEVAASSPRRVELRLRDGRVVFWGSATDSRRKATIATALLGEKGHRIDVSADEVATVR